VDRSPELCMWYASWLMLGGEFSRVDMLLDTAERGIRSSSHLSGLAGVYAYRAMAGFLREDAQPTIENAQRWMAYISDENRFLHAPITETLARGYFLKGALAEAERVWAEASRLAQAIDGQRTLLFARAAQGELQRARGKLRQAAQLDQELLQQIGERPADIIKFRALGRLASASYEWNRLGQAKQYAQQALELAGQTRREMFARLAHLTLVRIHWALGEVDQAFEMIERIKALAQRLGGEHPMIEASASQARLWLAQDAQLTGSRQIQSTLSPVGVAGPGLTAAID